MCGAHRRDVLREVQRKLAAGEDCIVISTQVVEAGVDLDFDVVLRAYGPLDSIVQSAGRCNREGKLEEGRVVVFRPAEAGALPGQDYRTATQQAANMLQRRGKRALDLHDPGVFREYFSRLYQILPTDAAGIQDVRARFDYQEVAQDFRLI
jgi:CRISPR-associated endonuclease/helicase Cas3